MVKITLLNAVLIKEKYLNVEKQKWYVYIKEKIQKYISFVL